MATVYTAIGDFLTTDGYFSVRLRYAPLYVSGSVTGIHTLLAFSDTVRLFFRGADSTFVFDVEGEELVSAALTFTPGTELTIDVHHTEERRRLVVSGIGPVPTKVNVDPLAPIEADDLVYVLGTDSGSEPVGVLVELRPLNAVTFAELTSERMLSQMKAPGDFSQLLVVLSEQAADYYDTCLSMVHAFTLEHAHGAQLDMIGAVVGLGREGHTDDRYRQLLGIQIELLLAVAREEAEWTGTAPNLLRITRKFIGDGTTPIALTNHPPYAYQLDVPDLDLDEADLLVRFLTTATYGGVQLVVTAVLDDLVWDSAEEDVSNGGIWDSAEGDVPGALSWSMVL